MRRFQVSVVKEEDAFAGVREALDLLGGMEKFVDRGDEVLIKPNNIISRYVRGTVTSAEVVAAIALLVKEAGGRPFIGENRLVYDPSSAGFEDSCGRHYHDALAQIGLEEEAPLVDLMASEMVKVEIPDARVFKSTVIARAVLDADKIIDVPVLKTHDQTQVTLGIKNLKGVLPWSEKKRSHAKSVERAIVDLCSFLKPALVVVDGLVGAEGMGPTGGSPVKMDLIIAGGNALAADMVATSVMGFDIERIKFLKYAVESGLGPTGLEEIEVLGEGIEAVRRVFLSAQCVVLRQYEEMGIDVISQNACSGCWAEFRHIYYSLGEERTKLKGLTFVLGKVGETPCPDGAIILGECARTVADRGTFLPGCPPHHDEIERAARERAGMDGKCGMRPSTGCSGSKRMMNDG